MQTRRNFIKTAEAFAAGAMILPNLSFKIDKNIGIQLYSLRNELPKDVRGVIAKVAAAGYRNVENYGYSSKGGFWGLSPKEFKALLDANGLKCPSGHYGVEQYLTTNGANDFELKSSIEAANVLGCKYYTIPWFGWGFTTSADGFKKAAVLFSKIAEAAKAAGLKTAYHNHDFEFVAYDGVTGYDILLKDTDASLLKMEADLYWVVRAKKDPVELFAKNPGRFVMWHVKDMDKTDNKLNTEVGSGLVDFKKIFAKQELAGVETIFMEQENFTNIDPYVSIGRSIDYIKRSLM